MERRNIRVCMLHVAYDCYAMSVVNGVSEGCAVNEMMMWCDVDEMIMRMCCGCADVLWC